MLDAGQANAHDCPRPLEYLPPDGSRIEATQDVCLPTTRTSRRKLALDRQLDCVDEKLAIAKLAETLDVGTLGKRTGKFFKLDITPFLKSATACKQKLETDLRTANPPQPALKPIHAVFTPSPVPGCSPPACTTVYTENATGEGLTYRWTVAIPADPSCANGFQPNKPQQDQATWYHADVAEGGSCNHTGTTYDASGRGHPGTVVVHVSNTNWSCAATYYGTQGDGVPVGDGPAPQACEPKAKPS